MTMLSDTQILFRDSVARYLRQRDPNIGESRWGGLAELGCIGAAVPEDLDGFGGPTELGIVARELGYALAIDSYSASGILPALFMALYPEPFTGAFAEIVAGERIVSAAPWFGETIGGEDLHLKMASDGGRLTGELRHLVALDGASQLLVSAAIDGDQRAVLLLDTDTVVPISSNRSSIDGGEHGFVRFRDFLVPPKAILADKAASAAFGRASDAALLGQCAELVGNMSHMFDLTRAYLQTRRQFGQFLAGFQALRHRLADMFAELDQAQAMLAVGIAAFDLDPVRRAHAISACKLRVSQAARYVGAQAMQLHGAIALTEEYAVGRYYRRSLVLRKIWGDEQFHARRMTAARRTADGSAFGA